VFKSKKLSEKSTDEAISVKNKKIKLTKLGALKNLTNLQPHLRAKSIDCL
jgi:hypothetical protein